jgi:hypothetical protein
VQVTATFGWTTIPDAVKQAVLIQCAADMRVRDLPGYIGTNVDIKGLHPRAADLLNPYVHPYVRSSGGMA